MARFCRVRRCRATTGACPCSRSSARWRPKTGTTCDDGKRGGGARKPSHCSHVRVFTRPARRTVAAVPTVASISSVTARTTRAAVIAVAVLALAQHHRRAGFMLVDAYGEIADDVLVDAQEALDLGHRRGRGRDVYEGEVRLAVLLDAKGKRLQTPGFDLGDSAAERGDLR